MDDVDFALSNPGFLRKNPSVIRGLVESPNFQILQKLRSNGPLPVPLEKIGQTPIGGVTLGYDSISTAKNYKNQNDYSYLLSDVKIPGNAPVSQLVHKDEDHRLIIPYAAISSSPEQISIDIANIKIGIINVCKELKHEIADANILVNYDEDGNAILQVTTKAVRNLQENKFITDLIGKDTEKYCGNKDLIAKITHGYEIFRYNEYFQKYPLLKETPSQEIMVLSKLIKNPHSITEYIQPIIIINNGIINNGVMTINNIHNSGPVVQGNNNTTITVTVNNIYDAMDSFVTYIRKNRPEWYRENTWIHMCEIRRYFDDIFKQQFDSVGDKKFNKYIRERLGCRHGKKIINGTGRAAVLLKLIKELK